MAAKSSVVRWFVPVAGAMLGVLGAASLAQAQVAPAEPYWAALAAPEVLLRSGENEKFYPVGRARTGTLLRIDGEAAGWARVAYPPGGSVFVAADAVKPELGGKAVRVVRPTHPRAARLDAAQAVGSWKPATLQPLAAGTLLTLESPAPVADVGGKSSYRVYAPADSRAYVPVSALVRATPEQVAAYTARLKEQGVTLAGLDTGAPAPAPTEQAAATPAAESKPLAAAPTVREPTIAERLEASFVALRSQPVLDAEVTELIAEYDKAIAQVENSPLTVRTRAQMQQRRDYLKLQERYQNELRAMEASKPKVGEDVARAAERLKEVESSRIYILVGRLSASTLYDGKRLPLMYRVQSVGGPFARTLAYIKPDENLKLESKIGQVVGVIGDQSIDSTLKLTLVTPRRVDVLAPENSAPAPSEAAPPETAPAETAPTEPPAGG